MSVVVADNNKGLEPGSLTGTCLLLHWHDLHDLVLEGRAQEGLHNLVLLHWHGEQVNLLQGLDLALQCHSPLNFALLVQRTFWLLSGG